jgi:hypothetical protein
MAHDHIQYILTSRGCLPDWKQYISRYTYVQGLLPGLRDRRLNYSLVARYVTAASFRPASALIRSTSQGRTLAARSPCRPVPLAAASSPFQNLQRYKLALVLSS